MGSSTRLRRRIPAVSTKRIGPSSVSITVSIASRVVPGSSCTTERSLPTSRLNNVDFPTLGRPTIATDNMVGSPDAGVASGSAIGGNRSTSASSRSPLPRPCIADTPTGSPSPSRANAKTSASRRSSSTLFTTTSTGFAARRSTLATWSSSSVMPTVTSTTNSTRSASAMARSACLLTCRVSAPGPSPAGVANQPPVSTTTNSRPFQSATSSLRSRVTPGCSSTIASRRPTKRLTSVDFPTFGRPTTATTGGLMS